MKDLLLWSGGLDSTVILCAYLKEKKPLDLLYFDLNNNHHKSVAELIARDRIKQILRLNNPDDADYLSSISDNVVEISHVNPAHNSFVTYWQPFIWLTSLIKFIPTEGYNNILMGYIQEDDFWHIRREFEDAYKNLQAITSPEREKEWPTLKFPLEWENKKRLYKALSENKIGSLILDQIWYCEMPNDTKFQITPCGVCNTCEKWKKITKDNEPKPKEYAIESIDKIKILIKKEPDNEQTKNTVSD